MTPELFERECRYSVLIAIAREMFDRGILPARELRRIETIFREKYRPFFGPSLFENA